MKTDNVIPFNPLDKKHLGESVGQAMLKRPIVPLADLSEFRGAGIYAIYYSGAFPAYEALSSLSAEKNWPPIYVGKAVPPGARKGLVSTSTKGSPLFKRLIEHKKSIEAAANLALEDFHCRFLVVDDIWIPLGESLLIAKFGPLWNQVIDGFGNHDPGAGRYNGLVPRWDVLHPGRAWAEKLKARAETALQIETEIINHLENNPPPEDGDMLSV